MDPADDVALIRACLAGDDNAFRHLVMRHQGFAFGLARRFTRNSAEAEDIVQEAFVAVWKNLPRYREGHAFRAWLGSIVTHRCLDYLKSARARRQQPLQPVHEQRAGDAAGDAELMEAISRLAEGLTEKQRAVFVLRDLEGLEPDEVCAWLEMSPNNMKSNLYYARQKIREGLELWYGKLPRTK